MVGIVAFKITEKINSLLRLLHIDFPSFILALQYYFMANYSLCVYMLYPYTLVQR